jgi:hypothetical protein
MEEGLPFCTLEDLEQLKKDGIVIKMEDPISPDTLNGITQDQIIIINKLIRQTWIPSLGQATFTWERLANDLGMEIDTPDFCDFFCGIQKTYIRAGWKRIWFTNAKRGLGISTVTFSKNHS